ALNAASLVLPTTGGTELGSNPAGIVVDAIAPTVLNVTGTSGTYGVGQAAVPVLVKFSEPVTVTQPTVTNFTGSIATNVLTTSAIPSMPVVTASQSLTTLTVTAVTSGTLTVGQTLNVPGFPTILAQLTSTDTETPNGGRGTYTLSNSQTVATTTVTGTLAVGQVISGTGVTRGTTIATVTSATTYTLSTVAVTGVTGTIDAANTLTVTAITAGKLVVGQTIAGANVTAGTRITAFGPGTSGGLGTYTVAGDDGAALTALTVTVASTAMTASGPSLTLNTTSPASSAATYVSGSGTDTLRFEYVVDAGTSSSKLNYVATTSLSAGGGSITDGAGNNATLALPALTVATSLGSVTANAVSPTTIVVDGVGPTIQAAPANVNGPPAGAGPFCPSTTLQFTVKFNEVVYVNLGTGSVGLTLNTVPSSSTANYVNGSGSDTLVFEHPVGETGGNYALRINYLNASALATSGNATITDLKGNSAALGLSGVLTSSGLYVANIKTQASGCVTDTTRPTVTSVTSSVANGSKPAGTLIPIQVVFSEGVVVSGTPKLTISTGGASGTTTLDYTSGSGSNTLIFNYTVAPGDSTSGTNLNYPSDTSLVIPPGTFIKDLSNNDLAIFGGTTTGTTYLPPPANASALGTTKSIIVDTAPPPIAVSYMTQYAGAIANNILTVTSVTSGQVYPGQPVYGANILPGTNISSNAFGTGGTTGAGLIGTYAIDAPANYEIINGSIAGTTLTAPTS
ncbi:MAG: hypothetical protein NTX54_05715, partial [Chloroflexi bacterium]|nr:hypothetical protein [Chloroflexota bacterium]